MRGGRNGYPRPASVFTEDGDRVVETADRGFAFVGRRRELDQLLTALRRPPAVV